MPRTVLSRWPCTNAPDLRPSQIRPRQYLLPERHSRFQIQTLSPKLRLYPIRRERLTTANLDSAFFGPYRVCSVERLHIDGKPAALDDETVDAFGMLPLAWPRLVSSPRAGQTL